MPKTQFTPILYDFDQLKMLQTAPESSTIDKDDFSATRQFLLSYRSSRSTFNAYRSEVEKFLQWMLLRNDVKKLDRIQSEDIKRYIEFLKRIPKGWVNAKRVKKFTFDPHLQTWCANPEWRPFVTNEEGKRESSSLCLSKNSIASSFRVLSTLFQFLVEEEYLSKNPVKRLRQKRQLIGQSHQQAPIRRLSELQWSYLISIARTQADESTSENVIEKERSLFIITLLYGLYLRISELVESDNWQPQMNHFFQDADRHWWFKTVGKGNKERDITVSKAVLDALKRYRRALGLSALPSSSEQTPLIPNLKSHTGAQGVRSTRHIRRLVQALFDDAYDAMLKDHLEEEADALKAATVHWLRHTGISDDVKTRPREHVRDDAGHSSSLTTDRYIDVERRARHQSGAKKPLDGLI